MTSIELLPIQAKQSELFLQERNRTNYWGYSTLGYFAPEASYATKQAQEAGAGAVRQEVIDMVRAMHEAGFEVIMDVVYNHTCESGPEGPTICWRGLDNLAYYRRTKDKVSRLYDTTGCGNSLDFTNTHVTTFAVDSLRYGPSESASTASASTLRRRWRVLTANSRDTTCSCTRCAPICCSATSR